MWPCDPHIPRPAPRPQAGNPVPGRTVPPTPPNVHYDCAYTYTQVWSGSENIYPYIWERVPSWRPIFPAPGGLIAGARWHLGETPGGRRGSRDWFWFADAGAARLVLMVVRSSIRNSPRGTCHGNRSSPDVGRPGCFRRRGGRPGRDRLGRVRGRSAPLGPEHPPLD